MTSWKEGMRRSEACLQKTGKPGNRRESKSERQTKRPRRRMTRGRLNEQLGDRTGLRGGQSGISGKLNAKPKRRNRKTRRKRTSSQRRRSRKPAKKLPAMKRSQTCPPRSRLQRSNPLKEASQRKGQSSFPKLESNHRQKTSQRSSQWCWPLLCQLRAKNLLRQESRLQLLAEARLSGSLLPLWQQFH